MAGRYSFTIIVFFLFYAGLVGNLYYRQIEKGSFYLERAQAQQVLSGVLEPLRGSIYFTGKDGATTQVATTKDFPTIYVVPNEIEDVPEAVAQAVQVLGISEAEAEKALGKGDDPYELLVRRPDQNVMDRLKAFPIAGIRLGSEKGRFYQFGHLGSHVLGFVGQDETDGGLTGKYGIESLYDATLRGIRGSTKNGEVTRATSGKDVRLTLDYVIQSRAETLIENLRKEFGATGASVMVQEIKTGKLLAMAASPSFDPNGYGKADLKTFLNPLVQAVYEPGSVMKLFTMSAGIDSGKITPDTAYYDNGSVTLNGRTIKNWDNKAHGRLTMANVIEQSINTGSVFAEQRTGHATFLRYFQQFGFNGLSGIALPGEVRGSLANLESGGRDINFATASFGQGISITPIELISAVSTLANGGVLMRPYLDASLAPQEVRRVISKETSATITDIMVSAVKKNVLAVIPEYDVAGKTGTAQVPDLIRGGYSGDVINSYVGFAPASDPRVAVVLRLDRPVGAPLAGQSVVPAWRELMQFVLNYYNIPPDHAVVGASAGQ